MSLVALVQNLSQYFFGNSSQNQVQKNVSVKTDSANVVKKHTMNYFDPEENSNKVWVGIAYDDGLFETQFGRVRDMSKLMCKQKKFDSKEKAERELEKKRKEKIRKGYKDTVVLDNEVSISNAGARNLSKIAAEQISGVAEDSVTNELIKYLAEVNIHHITHVTSIRYNASNATFSTPLGILTPDAVSEARDLLNEITIFNEKQLFEDEKRAKFIRDYFQLVPKDFGMRVPKANELLANLEDIQTEVSVLEALESAIDTTSNQPKQKLFQCRLNTVPYYTDDGKKLFRDVKKLFESTRNNRHHPFTKNLQMTRIYEVEIEQMKARFEAKAKEIGNIRQDLWHGTRASNLLSILKNGLVIPPANATHCTGRMFGNGIYTSLQSTKALNYATNYWNRSGVNNQRTFMFLCEVALGKTYKPTIFHSTFPKKGTDSTWVKPLTAGVLNHECIVYDIAQINLKYLVEFGVK